MPKTLSLVPGDSVNGSAPFGHCTSILTYNLRDDEKMCNTPHQCILFDGHTPRVTGDRWASGLLTLQPNRLESSLDFGFEPGPDYDSVVVTFDFSSALRMGVIQVVLFNCPEWEIFISRLTLYGASQDIDDYEHVLLANLTFSDQFNAGSCDSFWTLNVYPTLSDQEWSTYLLVFGVDGPDTWVHLAEVAFYAFGHVPTSATPSIAGILNNTFDL